MIHLQSIEQRRLPGSKTILPSDTETETETETETDDKNEEETETKTDDKTDGGKCTH